MRLVLTFKFDFTLINFFKSFFFFLDFCI
jgi:hypothetical protein